MAEIHSAAGEIDPRLDLTPKQLHRVSRKLSLLAARYDVDLESDQFGMLGIVVVLAAIYIPRLLILLELPFQAMRKAKARAGGGSIPPGANVLRASQTPPQPKPGPAATHAEPPAPRPGGFRIDPVSAKPAATSPAAAVSTIAPVQAAPDPGAAHVARAGFPETAQQSGTGWTASGAFIDTPPAL